MTTETTPNNERTLLTVDDITEMAFYMNPTEIAHLDALMRKAGFSKLANAARRQGINNCGSDYAAIYNKVDFN